MEYFETETGEQKVQVKIVDKNTIVSLLEYIKRGYLPDYNYTSGKDEDGDTIQLPNEYYPLHVAMSVAIRAVEEIEKHEPDFFTKMDSLY